MSKLKENNKYVIGLGVKNSTSDLLIENCDEFIFYEDLVRGQQRPLPVIANVPEKVQECFALLVDSILALQRENKEVLWGSMVKETMKRKKPSFNETYYGFRTFSHLLEDAQRRNIVVLRRDQKSGSYIVEDLGTASASTAQARAEGSPPPAGPRPVEAVGAALASAPAPENGLVAEGSEGASGVRGVRRRRGRGRRARGASTLAAGAYMDGSANEHPDDAADGDEHDHDDDGDEMSGSEEGHGADAHPPAESAGPPEAARAEPERHAFSLFSWIRRDAPPEPRPDAPPAVEERKPEGSE